MRAVNLIPVEQRTGAPVGAGRSQGGAYAVLALIAGLAIMAALYGKADHTVSSEQSQVASLTAEAQRTEAAASRLAPYTSFVAMSEQRLQAVQTLLESRFDWAHVFHEFGRVLPAGTSISSLTGSVGASSTSSKAPAKTSSSTVASATPPGSVPTFSLTGCAVSQAAVAAVLERLRLIDGVSEVELESSTASATVGGASTGASSGGCPTNDPSYTVVVTFDALPSASAVAAASTPTPTATVTEKSGPSASAPSANTTSKGKAE